MATRTSPRPSGGACAASDVTREAREREVQPIVCGHFVPQLLAPRDVLADERDKRGMFGKAIEGIA